MKRKEYIQPEVQIFEMETRNVMVNSQTISDINTEGGEATTGSSDAASYRNNLWDN